MRLLALLILICLVAAALADGMAFQATGATTLQEKRPSFPTQRAVLKWDGEVETMIVESTLAGPRGTYGWVVPLPTRPTFVKAVKPDYVANTFAAVRPPVVPLKERNLLIPGAVVLLVAALLLTSGLRYRRYEVEERLMFFFGELLGGAILIALAWNGFQVAPSHAEESAKAFTTTASAAKAGGITVERLGTIGSYNVSVLSGEQGKPLMGWLIEHRIRVPEDALKVIDRYAKERWCFLAAEFRKVEDQPLPPHPLKAVFPSRRLIYPMRLTGTQDQPMHLEMVVVADRLAQVPHLDPWACDDRDLLIPVPPDERDDATVYSDWKGTLYAMAKDGAVFTYLRGDVSPEQMQDDYLVSWRPIERFQAQVHDRGQAVSHAFELALLWLPFVAAFFGFTATIYLDHVRTLAIAGAIVSFAAAGVVGDGWLHSVKTVEAEQTGYGSPAPRFFSGGRSLQRVQSVR